MTISPLAAILALTAKLALPTETFTEIWGAQHTRAFVVAGANTEAIVTDFYEAVKKAGAEGQTREDFQKSFDAIVAKHGWSYKGERRWRSAVIYNTNMRQAYLTAKWQRFWDNRKYRPFLMYQAVRDKKTRPQHLEWHGVILPIEHPWWDSHYPMNGWNCRCDVRSLDQATMDREGLSVWPEPPFSPMVTREVRSAAGRFFETVPRGIDPGFNYNVGRASSGGAARTPVNPVPGLTWVPVKSLAEPKTPLPDLPVDKRLAAPLSITPIGESELRQALRDVLGGNEKQYRDPTGISILVDQLIVDHMLLKASREDQRSRFFPLIPEIINDPAEIWLGFEVHEETGQVRLRRRYVKIFALPNSNKTLGLVFDMVARRATIVTFFVSDGPAAAGLRTGFLAYRR